jgi:5,6-dimethylbenzimidazole synthase
MIAPTFTSDFHDMLDHLLIWRRDVRHFETRALEEGMVGALLDRACLAPSVGNSQPWRFVRVMSAELRAAITAHVEAENSRAAALYDGDAKDSYSALKLHGLREAPEHLAVFCDMKTDAGRGLGRQTMPETLVYSTVLAVHTLWLAARARGIGLGWVSILDPATVAAMLDVPADWRFVGYLCLGYATEENPVAELERRGWQERLDPALTRFIR